MSINRSVCRTSFVIICPTGMSENIENWHKIDQIWSKHGPESQHPKTGLTVAKGLIIHL